MVINGVRVAPATTDTIEIHACTLLTASRRNADRRPLWSKKSPEFLFVVFVQLVNHSIPLLAHEYITEVYFRCHMLINVSPFDANRVKNHHFFRDIPTAAVDCHLPDCLFGRLFTKGYCPFIEWSDWHLQIPNQKNANEIP